MANCRSALVLLAAAAVHPVSPLALAWRHTEVFWAQTGRTLTQHWFVLLLCAAVPAAVRAFLLLRPGLLQRGQLSLVELLITLWRVLLCIVVVWAACRGSQWHQLASRVGAVGAWQVSLGLVGLHAGHRLHSLLWELVFYVLAFLIADRLLRWGLREAARADVWLRETRHRHAVVSVLWNLILVPTAAIYLVEIGRSLLV
ncbi:MAG TPA: hypothetical protein VIY53_05755 [Acidobacteriaceae bacterium]